MPPRNDLRPTPHDVLWTYRILLGRDPENRSVIDASTKMQTVDQLRASVIRSVEFQTKFSGKNQSIESSKYGYTELPHLRADLVWHSLLSVAEIQLAYNAVLRRDVESFEIAQKHVQSTPNLFELIRSLIDSPEFRMRAERDASLARFERRLHADFNDTNRTGILLFGAYENGNIGDMCQADALRRLIQSPSLSEAGSTVVGCSWERTASSDAASQATYEEILDPRALKSYKFIIMGGGGLLATPHFPLFVEQWVRGLQTLATPYALVGVGASEGEIEYPDRAAAYRLLVEGAAFVSGRDDESLRALRAIRDDVHFLPDPFFMANFNRGKGIPEHLDQPHLVIVPKYPVNTEERDAIKYLRKLSDYCQSQSIDYEVMLFEHELDKDIAGEFQSNRLITSVDDFSSHLTSRTIVYSMRYHGLIFALCNRTSCWAIGAKKGRDLLASISLEHFILNTAMAPESTLKRFEETDWAKVDAYHQTGIAGLKSLEKLIQATTP